MKSLKSIRFISIIAIAYSMTFSACKKKDDTTTPPANGTLGLHLHTNVGSTEIEPTDNYGDTLLIKSCDTCSGTFRRIIVTKAQLYISGIQLVKSDGSTVTATGNVLKVKEEEEYIVGSVASGNYVSINFNVGLDASTNGSTPSSSNPTLYRKDMWFDSTMAMSNNFIFVDFEGSIDTSTTLNGSFAPFKYRIGTNNHLKNIAMPNHQTQFGSVIGILPSPAAPGYAHMIIDYAKLFHGIPLNAPAGANLQVLTAVDNGTWIAAQVANNIPLIFTYEE